MYENIELLRMKSKGLKPRAFLAENEALEKTNGFHMTFSSQKIGPKHDTWNDYGKVCMLAQQLMHKSW